MSDTFDGALFESLSDGNKKYRSRNYNLLLYPDNESHSNAMELIRKTYKYAACLHTLDLKDDGTLKKPHWHVVVRFAQARWNTALADELGIETRFLESTKSVEKSLKYLIHADHPEKAQYEIESVEGDLKVLLEKYLLDVCEDERILQLIDLLDSFACPVSYSSFVRVVCSRGLYSDFRRSALVMTKLISEHNYLFPKDYI